jgi:DNA-binding transcriptional MerR regulator
MDLMTTGALARASGTTVPLVVKYCDLGLLPHQKASDGTRLFTAEAADVVRGIKATRMANRGRRSAAQAAA